jgi:hypothetical protein
MTFLLTKLLFVFIKHSQIMAVKLTFQGTEQSKTSNIDLECYESNNEIAIVLTVNDGSHYTNFKCIALDKGYDFGVVYPERFKGFFPNLELPEVKGFEFDVEGQPPVKMPDGYKYYRESMDNDGDYDDFIFNIPDNYIIHGNLQGVKYFEKHREEIKKWLYITPFYMSDDTCVINFRGGEYVGVPEFFLPQSYWDNAIKHMKEINPNMMFEVHTDDYNTARKFFPHEPIISDIRLNWKSIRYAKYLILSNSSFALLPAWLGDAKKIIAINNPTIPTGSCFVTKCKNT